MTLRCAAARALWYSATTAPEAKAALQMHEGRVGTTKHACIGRTGFNQYLAESQLSSFCSVRKAPAGMCLQGSRQMIAAGHRSFIAQQATDQHPGRHYLSVACCALKLLRSAAIKTSSTSG